MGKPDVLFHTVSGARYDCVVAARYYPDGTKKLQLLDIVDDIPVATATVRVSGAVPKDDEVFIKDYGENEGMLDALLSADIIQEPHGSLFIGYVTVHRCRLTRKGRMLWS